jgi:hypothetical protein
MGDQRAPPGRLVAEFDAEHARPGAHLVPRGLHRGMSLDLS